MAKPLRVGIIGVGKHGSRYANHIIAGFPKTYSLAAICRRNSLGKEQARQWQTRWFTDYRRLIEDKEVDCVIAATTPDQNLDIARYCAAAGKPLLLEKPMAIDHRQAATIGDLFAQAGVALTIAQTLRYNPVIHAIAKRLPQLGRLYHVAACQRLEPTDLSWLGEKEVAGGGVILHVGVHVFDTLRYLLNEEVVRLRASYHRFLGKAVEDAAAVELEFANGIFALVDTSKLSPSRSGRYEFIGARGQLLADQVHGELRLYRDQEVADSLEIAPTPALVGLLTDWHGFLSGRGENPIPPEEGIEAVKICEACTKSAASGGWVRL